MGADFVEDRGMGGWIDGEKCAPVNRGICLVEESVHGMHIKIIGQV